MTRSGSFLGQVVDGLGIQGVALGERVRCECSDSECGCAAACTALAIYCWGSVEAGDWQYLCHRCAERMVERGTRPVHADDKEAED